MPNWCVLAVGVMFRFWHHDGSDEQQSSRLNVQINYCFIADKNSLKVRVEMPDKNRDRLCLSARNSSSFLTFTRTIVRIILANSFTCSTRAHIEQWYRESNNPRICEHRDEGWRACLIPLWDMSLSDVVAEPWHGPRPKFIGSQPTLCYSHSYPRTPLSHPTANGQSSPLNTLYTFNN